MSIHAEYSQIIWAIDPFETGAKPDSWAIRELEHWAQSTNTKIQPVHVLAVSKLDYGYEEKDSWLARYLPCAERATLQYVHDSGVQTSEPPTVLIDHSSSPRISAQKLVEFAEHSLSQMIVLSSCGKSGLGQLIFGSFAETLVAQSHLPILFLTHQKHPHQKYLNRILFPTDFSAPSKKSFECLLRQIKTNRAEIILFSDVTMPAQTATFGTMTGIPWLPEDFIEKQRAWAQEEGKRWIRQAEMKGVRSKIVVKAELPNVADSILKTAHQEEVGLIAMNSQSGPVTAFMMGSVAREVFHANQYPVWICGPKVIAETPDSNPNPNLGGECPVEGA